MHDYLLSSEWVRFAFVLGIAVSMVMYEKRHLTTGSIVVPGYIAVFVLHPLVIVATFCNALVTYAFVNRVLRRYVLLYGRTKFTVLAVTSTLIQMAMSQVTPTIMWLWKTDVPLFVGVGYIVPALIAHDMARQGIRKTITSVGAAGAIVAAPIAVAIFLKVPGVNELAPVEGFGQIAISTRWIPVAMALAVLGSWAVARNYGLRSGGFLGAAFAGMFMGNPMQLVIAVVIAALTWLFVTRVLMRHMILFGRRKFSSMLIVSSMLSWWSLWIGTNVFGPSWQENFGVGSLALIPLLLPGLLANDAQRTSPARVLPGLVLVAAFTVSTTWWVQTAFEPLVLDVGWKLLSAVTALVLFRPQLAALARRSAASMPVDRLAPARVAARLGELVRPVRSVPSFGGPALALVTVPDATLTATPWEIWRDGNSDIADAAERWVDEELRAARRSIPSPPPVVVLPNGSELREPAPPHRPGSPVLRHEHASQRALRSFLRRSPLDPYLQVDDSPEASDAHREAQRAASDAPGRVPSRLGSVEVPA